MPIIAKLVFIAVAVGCVAPALYNAFRATPVRDRYRARHNVATKWTRQRYDKLWVIDRDRPKDNP